MYEEEIQVRNWKNYRGYHVSSWSVVTSFSTSRFSRSGMRSIQGKTCLSQTKAWSGIWTVPSLNRLPSQSLSSTHRLDLTASTNAQFASSTYTPPFQRFQMLRHPITPGLFQFPHAPRLPQWETNTGPFGRMWQWDELMMTPPWSRHCGQNDSSTGLLFDQWGKNVALSWPLQRLQQILQGEPVVLQYVVYEYCCRPFVTSCKSCST